MKRSLQFPAAKRSQASCLRQTAGLKHFVCDKIKIINHEMLFKAYNLQVSVVKCGVFGLFKKSPT